MPVLPLAESRIRQIALTVSDVGRARGFYEGVLGFQLLFEEDGMAFFSAGGLRLMLRPGAPARPAAGVILYFEIDDIEATYKALTAAGATSAQEPHKADEGPDMELWLAFVEDLDGYSIALMEERTKT